MQIAENLRGQHQTFISDDEDVEQKWEKFRNIVHYALDKFVPTKVLSERKDPPWYNYHVRKMLRKQRELHRRFKSSGIIADREKLNEAKKCVKRAMREAFNEFETKTLAKKSKQEP